MKGELIFRLTCLTEINLIKFAFKTAQRERALIKDKQFIFYSLKNSPKSATKKCDCHKKEKTVTQSFSGKWHKSRSRLQLRLDKNMMGGDLETGFYFPVVLIFTMVEFNIVKCYSRQ